MPELPEVETVARGLQQAIAGRRIMSVSMGKTDFIDDPAAIEQQLPGRRIERVERYGKFMLLRLSEANGTAKGSDGGTKDIGSATRESASAALLVHLGMTGNLAPSLAALPHEKHTHVTFLLDDGRELRYTDSRRFGRMAYLERAPLGVELERFGADPLEITSEEFAELVRGRRARIKALLLDQSVLRGVGNIYADESLWRAQIHPARLGANLNLREVEVLRRALQAILRNAIALRGSSISDFLDAEGQPGEYQRHHRAYGREGKKCFRCGATIRRAIVAGRSSYFCPACQHAPRGKRRTGKRVKRMSGKSGSKG
ncbi:MAG TPA: bifunctional DNA-formamidopyrimidine glycosylase/DNA-(apurinic or apyrimidinic site) lyase [Terriglobales bacterium]|nr:bifunctional DNA-formamidopyrimidine glycosylase/DNA-(apurinic or apyrimidinic site) lyase [Terriglobales bacterium]